jgi:hypothetical protein
MELPRLHDFLLIPFLGYDYWCTLPNLPEIIGRGSESSSTGGAATVSAGSEVSGQWLVRYVLKVETVAAEERVGFYDGGGTRGRG